jgi:hypothetical protein
MTSQRNPTPANQSGRIDRFIHLSLTLTAGVALTTSVLAVALIAWYGTSSKSRATLNFAVTTFATVAGVTSAVYALRGIKLNLDDKKIDRSLTYIQRWNDPAYFQLKNTAAEIYHQIQKKSTSVERRQFIIEQVYGEPQKKQEISNLLNFLEEMSLCIENGLLDEKLMFEYYRYIVITYCNTFQEFIDISREDKRSQKLYIGLTNLRDRWK